MIRSFFLTLLISMPSLLVADGLSLQWPIDRPMQMTGTFGEYRGIHYHHGIDISTDGKKGFAVLAAADGFVAAVMYQQWGIGYAVFIGHAGGYRTLYGHLERFAPPILASPRLRAVEERIQNRRDFHINFRKGEVPVRGGDIIGYSGDSGIGLEHFHFELRDRANRYLNPFAHGMALTDTAPPVITAVTVIPLDGASRVDGRYAARILKVVPDRKQPGRFLLAGRPPVISGRAALSLTAYDTAGLRNPLAPYEITCSINGRQVRHLRYDRIERALSHRIGLDYDDDESSFSRYTYWLYDRVTRQGVMTALKPGEDHAVAITCADTAGNTSTLAFTIPTAPGPPADHAPAGHNLRPGQALTLASDDGRCRVEFARDAALYAEEVTLVRETAPPPALKGITPQGSVYAALPTTICIDRPLTLRMSYEGEDAAKMGVYRISKSGKSFGCVGTGYDARKKEFTVSLWRPGRFFLARDEAPPRLVCRQRSIRPGDPLRIYVSDIGTGVDLTTVSLTVDGSPVAWDYDPDRYCLEILPHNPVWTPGKHRIEASVRDRAGNASGPHCFDYTVK